MNPREVYLIFFLGCFGLKCWVRTNTRGVHFNSDSMQCNCCVPYYAPNYHSVLCWMKWNWSKLYGFREAFWGDGVNISPPRPGLFLSLRPEFLEKGQFDCWPIKTLCQAYFPRDYYTVPSLSVCVNVSDTKWICCWWHVFCLFSVKVCPWCKTQKIQKKSDTMSMHHIYTTCQYQEFNLELCQCRSHTTTNQPWQTNVDGVSHKTMMNVLEVESACFYQLQTRLRSRLSFCFE